MHSTAHMLIVSYVRMFAFAGVDNETIQQLNDALAQALNDKAHADELLKKTRNQVRCRFFLFPQGTPPPPLEPQNGAYVLRGLVPNEQSAGLPACVRVLRKVKKRRGEGMGVKAE